MISSNVILDAKDLREKVKRYLDQPLFVCDIETMPPPGMHSDLRGHPKVNQTKVLSFAAAGDAFVVPTGFPNGNRMLERPRRRKVSGKFVNYPAVWSPPPDQIRTGEVMEILHPLFYHPEIEKVGAGFIFDVLSLLKYYDNDPMPGNFGDVNIGSWLLNENTRNGLKDQTKARYNREYDPEHVGRKIEIHPFNKVMHYAFMDARFTLLHNHRNMEELEREGLMDLYHKEMKIFEVLQDMEVEGMPVDRAKMEELEPLLARQREQCEGQVYKAAGKMFNLNSAPQKQHVLYDSKEDGGQGLKPWKLTKGGFQKKKAMEKRGDTFVPAITDYSTDAESLERFEGQNKVVDAIMAFQEVDRVLGTYIHGYIGRTVPDDPKKDKPCVVFNDRVYPDFVQYGTVTGRFSCREPNLQNIPRADTELGKQLRQMFIAGPGHKLIVADYGQIELVVLAHFVGKGALYEGFFQGIDPHTMTAAVVFNQDPAELQQRVNDGDPEAKGWRQAAKAINFAVVYGAGPDKVASMAKVTVKRAKQILAEHERQFPEIYKFKDKALHTCRGRKPPHLSTLWGRKRRIPAINSRDWGTAGRAERQAINSLIQGSAADIIKFAMIRLNDALKEQCPEAKLLMTVHDELVVRAPEHLAEKAAEIMREAMVGPGIQAMVEVPLSIDLNIGNNWAEAK